MKLPRKRFLFSLVAFIPLTAPSVAQVLSIGSETIGPGGTATVALDISGLTPGSTALGTYDVNVGFNPGLITFGTATFGDPVLGSDELDPEGYGTINTVTAATGTVDVFELSLDDSAALLASQPSGFTLATLTFNAVGTGTSALSLSVNTLGDENGNSLSATLENGSITVQNQGGGGGTVQAPEMDPSATMSALSLLIGALLVYCGGQKSSLVTVE
jgi:hypothetical protein